MRTYIPAEMQDFIDNEIGHRDYAPYVLDGQIADTPGDDDDWHDVLVIINDPERGEVVVKFTWHPGGTITVRELTVS